MTTMGRLSKFTLQYQHANMMKYFLFFFSCHIILSCGNVRQVNSINQSDTIFVLYYVTNVETPIRMTKEQIAHHAEMVDLENIISLEEKEFKQIENLIKACHNDSTNQEYDARVYLKVDTFQMCLPYHESIISSKDIVYKYLKTVYLLKWKSGFYNSMPLDELKYQLLIVNFGIPQDYHFQSCQNNAPPFKLVRKVAFVKSKKQ